MARSLREKIKTAQEQELKKLEQIKRKELGEWKRKSQSKIQTQIDGCIGNFGDAHIAAVNASCEESEIVLQKKEEYDLMAAVRGKVAMLQEQRKRDKEAEEKIIKRKKSQQKTIGVQADFLTQKSFSQSLFTIKNDSDMSSEENLYGATSMFTSKPNHHKHSTSANKNIEYIPKNYASNSIDSSYSCDTDVIDLEEEDEISDGKDSELEFNQITNLIFRQKANKEGDENINDINIGQESKRNSETLSSSSVETNIPISPAKLKISKSPSQKRKGILKKSSPKQLKTKTKSSTSQVKKIKNMFPSNENRVRYVDFANQFERSYTPNENLITRNNKSSQNAIEDATQTDDYISSKINEDILK